MNIEPNTLSLAFHAAIQQALVAENEIAGMALNLTDPDHRHLVYWEDPPSRVVLRADMSCSFITRSPACAWNGSPHRHSDP